MTVLPANVPPANAPAPSPATPGTTTPFKFIETARAIESEVGRVIIGQPEVVRGVLTCLLAGGHALLEGIPVLGKTLLVRTIGETLDLSFSRVQFTPDLMPADITGTSILRDTRRRAYPRIPARAAVRQPGPRRRGQPRHAQDPVRAPGSHAGAPRHRGPRTHTLPEPFVLATQNPIEMQGTYPLPES